ncbi:MAG TPA: Asp-tRNA(Asn)/Glu-tRNA(Gln) amidotransferase GatCAB subunit B, partial [Actinobacteria bacterium]|nr:Asp-tRNA(Asn)/Glu-tRNA(Gln) amidotransferase GatCAB subunit B [Actinomycetes bacterium]HEX21316.1 Asp-tRNA(Asn)/Glu-tRNA(Gln) amidotransferase GatCAB subunit B [Actinomycetota bacterium]
TDLIKLINEGRISGKMAKEVFEEMFVGGKDPQALIEEKGLAQISDESAIAGFVDKAIEANPMVVAEYKAGKKQAIGFLVGQIMKASRGQANPKLVNEILQKKLQ